MNLSQCWAAYLAIVRYEARRLFRLWPQTLLPPVMTSVLYFIIFGNVIGTRIGNVYGVSYMVYIAPGLVMMQMLLGSYSAAVFSFFYGKYSRSIEEILVSPMSVILILLSFMSVGMMRGLMTGCIVFSVAEFFTHMPVHSVGIVILDALLTTSIFSLAGVINGVFAKKFDDIAIVPNFVLTPLTYFGGVFYAISMLPPVWRFLSHLNPIYYIVSVFRFGFLGVEAHLAGPGCMVLILLFVMIFSAAIIIFKRGAGLRA